MQITPQRHIARRHYVGKPTSRFKLRHSLLALFTRFQAAYRPHQGSLKRRPP